ncbi:response regulator transcription factor [Bdellovibrio svalbardensis]|uniref:Response regulator transcription factor n=1 Tax=Bdellovibrio svalbardensis TaxID=2972972 RepID=A0ABT6DD30_9BACT|nr:response regulator transcription factor [Bdellovibrio svalbardensis]MDG0814733.1 response regulator transcription factor [Bdellovibrio svalbardensis]
MAAKRIVIVDDYEESCKLLAEILGSTYECSYTSDSMSAVNLINSKKPDLILLDYKMPGLLGVDVCREVKENEATKNTPIIFVSGAATIDERIKAFETGADDFISKPFHVKELILRIKARLSEKEPDVAAELTAANLKMNLLSRQVYVDGEEVNLTPKQFDILKMLVAAKNHLVTREKCLMEIWGDTEVTSRNVDSQINYLKRKIQKFNGRIVAVPSLGYRLEAQE